MTSLDLQILHEMNIDFDTVHYCSKRVVPHFWIQLRRMSHELQFFYHTIAYAYTSKPHSVSHALIIFRQYPSIMSTNHAVSRARWSSAKVSLRERETAQEGLLSSAKLQTGDPWIYKNHLL